MKVFCYYLKEALLKEFSVDVDVFVSKKKDMCRFLLKFQYQSAKSFDQLAEFISKEWGKRKENYLITR